MIQSETGFFRKKGVQKSDYRIQKTAVRWGEGGGSGGGVPPRLRFFPASPCGWLRQPQGVFRYEVFLWFRFVLRGGRFVWEGWVRGDFRRGGGGWRDGGGGGERFFDRGEISFR